jgi:hypothetical protein
MTGVISFSSEIQNMFYSRYGPQMLCQVSTMLKDDSLVVQSLTFPQEGGNTYHDSVRFLF